MSNCLILHIFSEDCIYTSMCGAVYGILTLQKLQCFRHTLVMNTLVWKNMMGLGVFDGLCVINIRVCLSVVKFLELLKMNYCESIRTGCFHWSRSKVKKSKEIRCCPSLNHKRCRLEIGGLVFSDSGMSMIVIVKLKGIDRRTITEVELTA